MIDAAMIRGRIACALTLAAGLYGVVLCAWAGTKFGGGVVYVLYAQPIAASALVFVLLRRHCTTGSSAMGFTAAAVATLFLVWSVLGVLSLAAGSLPAACLLMAAVALTPSGGDQSPERSVSCSASRLV